MARRLVIERLSEGSVDPAEGPREVDAPSLAAIRLVYGVGKGPDAPPSEDTFRAVYTVSIPVFSLGGLDSDGIYEFDAKTQLAALQTRAQRRKWAVRLELELVQTADTVAAADVYVTTPYADDGPEISVAGRGGRGSTVAGGGRKLTLQSSLAHDGAAVEALGGEFSVRLADADPEGETAATVHSNARPVALHLGRYEFEG